MGGVAKPSTMGAWLLAFPREMRCYAGMSFGKWRISQSCSSVFWIAVVCQVLGLGTDCSSASEKSLEADGFQQFWVEFRSATTKADGKRLEELAVFPFTVRGLLDSDPVKSFDRAGFRALIPKLLAQDSGLTEKGESMRKLVARTLNPPGVAAQTSCRVGAYEFRVIEKKWRFERAYLDE